MKHYYSLPDEEPDSPESHKAWRELYTVARHIAEQTLRYPEECSQDDAERAYRSLTEALNRVARAHGEDLRVDDRP